MSTAKSVRTRADNRRARIMMNSMSMKDYFEERAAAERGPLFKGEQQCSQCGFKGDTNFSDVQFAIRNRQSRHAKIRLRYINRTVKNKLDVVKMEDFSQVATQWLLDAVGDSGKSAIKSVYLVFCKKTSMKGSGFLLKDGPIVTNEHVIHGCSASDIIVISSQGNRFQIKDIKADEQRDLAALILPEQLTDGLLLGDETDVSVGQIVWTWGFPLGHNGPAPLLSVGYLSGFKAYKKNDTASELIKHLVVNGAFNSGNSGGPLFKSNSDKVIGVVVNKQLPLFTPFVKSAIDAFTNNRSGIVFNGTDNDGKQIQIVESQVVAEVVKSLRDMSQVMLGEAISVSELCAFLKDNNICVPE